MQRLEDRLDDLFGAMKDVAIPKAQDAKARRSQETIATGIVHDAIDMLAAVQFDDERRVEAG